MKTLLLLFTCCFSFAGLFAQGTANDIPVNQLPSEVRAVLDQYITIISTSKDIDECAERFVAIAGGSLVNEDGASLRSSVKPFSLTKDFRHFQHYANPIRITRVNRSPVQRLGYGESAIRGRVYKIWIDKKSKDLGVPAPVSILVPEDHPSIKTPKVVNIGSF
jgi:hypothetical protein